jgi:hypothetical protein
MPEIKEPKGTPESSPPNEDVGADTQRRFRHQACYIGMLALGLLDDDGPLQELYCEHHDDVVLRLKSGQFRAIQLKTRMVGGVPFKAVNAEVIAALRKFATLEAMFPAQFDAYILASNVGFWHEVKNSSNLPHLLSAIRAGECASSKKLVNTISGIKPTLDSESVLTALGKVQLANTPGLDDVESRLRDQLGHIPEFNGRRYDELKAASEGLRDRIQAASSLAGIGALPEYLALCSSTPQVVRDQNLIQSKRINKVVVEEVVKSKLDAATLLCTFQPVPLKDLPRGMKKMELKMAAGGLALSTIDHLKDLKYSTESLLQRWLYKYGEGQAQQYYEHLRVAVQSDCLAAKLRSEMSQGFYANEMLSELQGRLAQRVSTQTDDTPDCPVEHLLGMAGILTEDCKVWWSAEFELPEGNE